MNDMQVPRPEQVTVTPPPSRPADPLRRWTLVILVLCVLLFGWTLIADRLTPYTSDASVRTFVVRIAPEVSGKVIEVTVRDNQIVRTGDLLFRIDPTPFRIAVERAEAKLAAAGQAVGASTAAVDAAQAQLVQEISQRDNARDQAARVFELVRAASIPGARRPGAKAVGHGRGAGAAGAGFTGAGASGARPPGRRQPADPRGIGRARAGAPRSRPHHSDVRRATASLPTCNSTSDSSRPPASRR